MQMPTELKTLFYLSIMTDFSKKVYHILRCFTSSIDCVPLLIQFNLNFYGKDPTSALKSSLRTSLRPVLVYDIFHSTDKSEGADRSNIRAGTLHRERQGANGLLQCGNRLHEPRHKLLERLILARLSHITDLQQMIPAEQVGFRAKGSV